jgi:hypothetical protein
MDPAAFSALVEQCAPTPDFVRPLTAIVRQASSFEPLLLTIQGRKPIPIQANDRDEAIQLATEAITAGQSVRTGLAQLDAEETKQAGLTATRPSTPANISRVLADCSRPACKQQT